MDSWATCRSVSAKAAKHKTRDFLFLLNSINAVRWICHGVKCVTALTLTEILHQLLSGDYFHHGGHLHLRQRHIRSHIYMKRGPAPTKPKPRQVYINLLPSVLHVVVITNSSEVKAKKYRLELGFHWSAPISTFQASRRTFMIASNGQGPFSFWVMIGVFSSLHLIHLMWYMDWPAARSFTHGSFESSAPYSLCRARASPRSSSPSLFKSELGHELRFEKDSSESMLRDSPPRLGSGSLPLANPSDKVCSSPVLTFSVMELFVHRCDGLSSLVASLSAQLNPSVFTPEVPAARVDEAPSPLLLTNFEAPPSLSPAPSTESCPIPLLTWSSHPDRDSLSAFFSFSSRAGGTSMTSGTWDFPALELTLRAAGAPTFVVLLLQLSPTKVLRGASLFLHFSAVAFTPPTSPISPPIVAHRAPPSFSRCRVALFSIST